MNDDHTIDADEAELARIRRFTERDGTASDHTVDADDDTLEQIRRLAAGTEVAGTDPPVTDPPVGGAGRRLPERPLSSLDVPLPPPAPSPQRPARSTVWEPPVRTVRATPDPEPGPGRHWKVLALLLAAVSAVVTGLLVWVVVDDGTSTTPTSSVPPPSAPASGPALPITGQPDDD